MMSGEPPEMPAFQGWRACDACGDQPLQSPAEGVLSVSVDLIEERREAFRERQEAAARGEAMDDAPPGLVPWDWGHRECFPGRTAEYLIDGDRIDSLSKMMARTLELFDADWFMETAWEDAVRRFYAIPIE